MDDFETDEMLKKMDESDHYLFKAYDSTSKSEAKKLAKKALELWPQNYDAENVITKYETNKIKKLKMYKETMDKAKAYLEEENIVSDEDIGHYYGICETRPYMRTRNLYTRTLIELGRYKEALEHCKEMVKLSENDNLGVRFTLIGLYAMFEEFDKVQEVYKFYGDDRLYMSLPLAISHYKKADYRKCKSLLKKIDTYNQLHYRLYNK